MTVEELYASVDGLPQQDKNALLKTVVFALWVDQGDEDEQTVNPDKEWNTDTLEEIANQVASYGYGRPEKRAELMTILSQSPEVAPNRLQRFFAPKNDSDAIGNSTSRMHGSMEITFLMIWRI